MGRAGKAPLRSHALTCARQRLRAACQRPLLRPGHLEVVMSGVTALCPQGREVCHQGQVEAAAVLVFALPEKTGRAVGLGSPLPTAPVVADQGPVRRWPRAARRRCPSGHSARPLPAALCFALTRSLLLTCLVPAGLLALRYYYSRKVVLAYLDCALHTDMADIEQYYMKPPGEAPAATPPPSRRSSRQSPPAPAASRGRGQGPGSLGRAPGKLSLLGMRVLAEGWGAAPAGLGWQDWVLLPERHLLPSCVL